MIITIDYLNEVKGLIGCPNTWEQLKEDNEFRRVLFQYWSEVASGHQCDNEMRHYQQHDCAEQAGADVLRVLRENVPRWKLRAIEEYTIRTRFLNSFRHLTQLEHTKHWSISLKPLDELVKSTSNGPAKYRPQFPLAFLEGALYEAVRQNWRRISEEKVEYLYAEAKQVIGGSQGKEASHIKFYLDYSDNSVHSRPILESEKPADEDWILDPIGFDIWPDGPSYCSYMATLDEDLDIDLSDYNQPPLQDS